MKTTIDAGGRVVIPRDIRRRAALEPGVEVEVRWVAGRIEIEPAPLPVRLVPRGSLKVAMPERAVPRLGAGIVEEVRAALQQERGAAGD